MADYKSNVNNSVIKKLEKNVQDNLNNIYTTVKFASPNISNTVEYMRSRFHRSIDTLMSNNISNSGISNISSLYIRSKNMQNDKSIINGIAETFENDAIMNNVMSLYSQNAYLRELDKEIEVVCKYMPKLVDAMDTRKEHVLSADHFSKNSVNIKNASASANDIAAQNNVREMRERYDIDELMGQVYDEADFKGECFVYIIPYKKAIARLLSPDNGIGSMQTMSEVKAAVNESYNFTYTKKQGLVMQAAAEQSGFGDPKSQTDGFTIEIDKTGIVSSCIHDYQRAESFIAETANLALNESGRILNKKSGKFVTEEGEENKPLKLGKLAGDEIKKQFYKLDPTASDGFRADISGVSPAELRIPGCVVKILDHSMVKPLYIEDVCLGYFYIEANKQMDLDQTTFSSTLGGIRPGGSPTHPPVGLDQDMDNAILKKIATEISEKIDKKFVNANQDLSKEIYLILKYNRQMDATGKINHIKVTFIPPDDMVHAYFNLDPRTHRGISGLFRALFPAKLYSCLYISNVITILTRGNDKRVYYVKQSVDTNIANVLLSTINQIKKSNFGLRQIENLNNIFNITGRFNDLIVPRSPSGEAPVDVEVMQGQNVEIKTELMEMLEDMAVSSTDVPMEVVNARQQLDYATHYTMTNTKFLRKIYNRQSKFKRICDAILTKVYNAEFECEDIIDTQLPPPMYLNLMNTGQIFQYTNELADNTVQMFAGDQSPEIQDEFSREIKKYYLSSFLPIDEINKMLDRANLKASFVKDKGNQY